MSCTVDRIAILKILLHSAKYSSAAINGLLIGTISSSDAAVDIREGEAHGSSGQAAVHIIDAIPLFHSFLTLATSLETALFQVQTTSGILWGGD